MSALTVFGVIAVSAMLLFYWLEPRSRHFTLAFAAACLGSSAYGWLSGTWPFGIIEAVWAIVAARRWYLRANEFQESQAMEEYISPAELRNQQEVGRAPTIIDVRSADEYAAGHLPGARNIPVDELGEHLAEIPRDRPVVTYCMMRHRGSARCERAADMLRSDGYQARAIEGGLPAWKAAGYPVEQ